MDEKTAQMQVYCVKCKNKKGLGEIDDAGVQRSGNRYALTGTCADCGTKVNRFLGKDDPLVKAYQRSEEKPPTASVQTVGDEATATVPEKQKLPVQQKKRKAGRGRKSNKEPDAEKGGKPVAKKKTKERSIINSTPASPVKVAYPLDIFVVYKGQRFSGRIMDGDASDIRVRGHGKTSFTSLTLAAKTCITDGKSVNGWRFWKFKAADGTEYYVDAIRNADDRKERGGRKSSGEKKSLPPYSTTYADTYPIPSREPPLPKRGVCYFVHPKYERWGHLVMMTVVQGTLVCVRYKKDGERATGVEQLGSYDTWRDALPEVNKIAEKRGYERVRVK